MQMNTDVQMICEQYDIAIRNGDIEYIHWVVNNHQHYNVPILNADPLVMLNDANHDSLHWLCEQGHIDLPNIVYAIIYDDPIHISKDDITDDVVKQILLRGAWEIFNEYHEDILHQCDSPYMYALYQTIA